MTNKILQIHFANSENSIYTLYFKLHNTSVTDKYVKIINAINSNSNVETRYNNVCIFEDKEKTLIDKYNELLWNIKKFEEENNNGKLFLHRFHLEDITNEKLNALHTEFEKYLVMFMTVNGIVDDLLTNENNLKDKTILKNGFHSDSIIEYLNNINSLIHYLEDIVSSKKTNTENNGFLSTYLYSTPYVKPILIEDQEYDLFTLDYKWGDLLLGYGTTGKSLFHLFKDSDIKLLENGFHLSPQQYVTPNIIVLFKNVEPDYDLKFENWYKTNEVYEKYDISFNKYNSSGYIKLGELIYSEEKEVINNLLKYDRIVGYEIV